MARFDPFQALIDYSQQGPLWWCRRCTGVLALCFVLWLSLVYQSPDDYRPFVLAYLIMSVMDCVWRSTSEVMRVLSDRFSSVFGELIAWLVAIFYTVYFLENSADAACDAAFIAEACFISFARRKPPAPPRRRTSKSLSRRAA